MEQNSLSFLMGLLSDCSGNNHSIVYESVGDELLCKITGETLSGIRLFGVGIDADEARATKIAISNLLRDIGVEVPLLEEVYRCPIGRFRGEDIRKIPIDHVVHWSKNEFCDDPVIDRFIRKCREILSNADPLDLI